VLIPTLFLDSVKWKDFVDVLKRSPRYVATIIGVFTVLHGLKAGSYTC
jgi:hypothetical protein